MDDLSHCAGTEKQGNTIGLMHLDQEFYSTGRVEAMLNRKYKFVQAVRFKDPWICQLIDQNRDMMGDPGSLFVLDGRDYYMRSIEYHWLAGEGEQSRKYPTTVHLFYSHDIICRDRSSYAPPSTTTSSFEATGFNSTSSGTSKIFSFENTLLPRIMVR